MKGSSIVLATDLSDNAGYAARWAHTFAKEHGLTVVVTHVVTISMAHWADGAYDVLERPEKMEKAEKKVRDWYEQHIGEAPDALRVLVGHARVQLCELVESLDAAMLVMAASGKGAVKKFFVGSTAQTVANDPPCPLVLVEPEHSEMHEPPRIVVGTDYSDDAATAVRFAARFARTVGGKLDIVHADTEPVVDVIDAEDLPPRYVSDGHYEWARDEMNKLVDSLEDNLEGLDHDAHVIEDAPAEGLLTFVEKNDADVVVVGRSGHAPYVNSAMGSVVHKVLRSIPTTTIIVPVGYEV